MRKLLILLIFPTFSWGHPVSYEDGFSLMSEASEAVQEGSFIYSPKWWLGTGAIVEKFDQRRTYTSAHVGWLVHRWNLEDAQGNLYLFGGPGYFRHEALDGETEEDGGFLRLGAQADYETRRIYTALRYTERRNLSRFDLLDDRLDASVGFAPYLAKFSELNSWVIFRVMTFENFDSVYYVPTLRFFYKNFLWEMGMSFSGMAQLNFMVRF